MSKAGQFREDMLSFLHNNQCKVVGNQIVRGKDGGFTYQFRTVCSSGNHTEALVEYLEQQENVITYNLQTAE